MNLSAPFIDRPVAATLIAAGLLILGALALASLPIASLPNVERPTIVVNAYLPGASPETVATALAAPLEHQLGTISGLTEMSSSSVPGGISIFLQFALSLSIDDAAAAVQAGIDAAEPSLPKDLPQLPTYWKANTSGPAAVVLALTSDVLQPTEVYELADSVVASKLGSLSGVAQVLVSGGERGAVRVRVAPRRLADMGLSLETLRGAIQAGSRNMPKGAVSVGDRSWTVSADDQLLRPDDWRNLVVALRGGAPIHLSDVAAVTDSVNDDKLAGWYGTDRGVLVFVRKQPDANVVDTVDAVKAALPELSRWLPPSVKIHALYDRTVLIRASVADVERTIGVAVALVAVVVLLFLRRLSATLVPVLSVPVALSMALVAMKAWSYSLDNLSLMALTIAVGFVVDDAVIVVEYAMRLASEGRSPREAALEAGRQMGFTIAAVSATLVAALLPVLFMPDVVGRYFREFGLTLAAAVVASGIVSLTLIPALCGRLPPHPHGPPRTPTRAAQLYAASLGWSLRHPAPVLLAFVLSLGGSAWLYAALPKGFMPTQDTGILQVKTVASANSSFQAMERLQRRVARAILRDPSVEALSSFIGGAGNTLSVGSLYLGLKPSEDRPPIETVVEQLRSRLARIAGIRTFFTPMQDLNLGGQAGASRYQYTLSGPDLGTLWEVADKLRRRMVMMPDLADIISNAERSGLEAGLAIDRSQAAAFGVTPFAIDNTLYDAFGQRQVAIIYFPTNYRHVILEVDPASGTEPEAIRQLYVPASGARPTQVPLMSLMRPVRQHGAMWINHSDGLPSITLSFATRPGVAIGTAMDEIGAAARDVGLPDGVRGSFRGEAAAAGESNARQLLLLAAAVLAIYIILGMLYESLIHPLTILSTLPSTTLGGLLALSATHTQLTLVASIALILVVGMVMRNAIIMVDFALTRQRAGRPPKEAILAAASTRARPILMTTLVAVLSAVPLAFDAGPGHELRQPLAIVSIGGLVVAQILQLYTTPVLFSIAARLSGWTPLAPLRRAKAMPHERKPGAVT